MKIIRTANAGILLEMEGATILLDGVCPPYPPFLGTPPEWRQRLLDQPPDALVFTHRHPDHYDEDFADAFQKQTLRPVFGAEDLSAATIGGLRITPVATRHIGKADLPHVSYIIEGRRCAWFVGDASPLVWKGMDLPKPDVLFLTYLYASTPSIWKRFKELGAQKIVLLHLPRKEEDSLGIWPDVEKTTQNDPCLIIPEIGEEIIL